MIQERMAALRDGEEPNKKAFLDVLLTQQKEEKLTLQDIREETDTFMFGGKYSISGVEA